MARLKFYPFGLLGFPLSLLMPGAGGKLKPDGIAVDIMYPNYTIEKPVLDWNFFAIIFRPGFLKSYKLLMVLSLPGRALRSLCRSGM
jgi:hypothetical protein